MKKNYIITALVAMMLPVMAGAQVLKGSYFLENSVNAHKLNPAFAPRANYFQLPVIGNLGVGVYSNLNFGTFLYPLDNGKVGTFLHPDVSLKQFDKALPKHIHFDTEFNTTILSFGFYNKNKAFWNFTLDTRELIDIDLSPDLFMFMKKGTGMSGESFNVGNVNMYATSAVQASLGYSREFIKNLRTGVKLRLVAPLAYVGFNLEKVMLNASQDKWSIQTEGYVCGVLQGLDVGMPENASPDFVMPEGGFDLNEMLANKVLAGMGYSLDLGARYILEIGSIIDGLTVSASVTDLGQVFYKSDAVAAFETSGQVEWTGAQDLTIDSELDVDLESYIEDVKLEFMKLANLKEADDSKKLVRSTMPRFHLGVEMPFLKRKMSVGLLYSSRLSHSYARNELTVSYNLKPTKNFALGLNYSFLNTRNTMGAILEFTPKIGPAFYIGCDYVPVKYAALPLKEPVAIPPVLSFKNLPIPMSYSINLNYGISFNMGSKHVNPKKEKKTK